MNEILEALKNKNYLVARTLLKNYGIDISKYSNDQIDQYVKAIQHTPYLQQQILKKFPVNSDLPKLETQKINIPSYEKVTPNDIITVRKPTSRTVNPQLLEKPVHNNISTTEMVLGALPFAAAAYPAVAGSWVALPAIAKTAIGTGVSSYFVADGIRDIYEGHPNWETPLKLLPGVGTAGKLIKAKGWTDAIEATPIVKTNWYRGRKIAQDLNNNIKGINFINGEPIYNGGLRITSSPEIRTVPTVSKVVDSNGNIRLQLSSHTSGKPREFVLEPQGNNKYYVHMRIWDGEKIPGQISNEERQTLYNALYKELPDNAEILFPKSGKGYYGTRGTVAGLKHLERDSRFSKGSPGTLLYKDKDDVVKTFEGTSFIKNPTTSRFIFTSQQQPTIPIKGTSLAFFERPSKLTEAERLGKTKGDRNQNKIIQNNYNYRNFNYGIPYPRSPLQQLGGVSEYTYEELINRGIDAESLYGPEITEEIAPGVIRHPKIKIENFSKQDPYRMNRLKSNKLNKDEAVIDGHNPLGKALPKSFMKYVESLKDLKPRPEFFNKKAKAPVRETTLFGSKDKIINVEEVPSYWIRFYRRYLKSLDYDSSNLSDHQIAQILTDQYNKLTVNQTGLVKNDVFWHGGNHPIEAFDFQQNTGRGIGNIGAIGPGNYFSTFGNLYGEYMEPFLINNIFRIKNSTGRFPYVSPPWNRNWEEDIVKLIKQGKPKPEYIDQQTWDHLVKEVDDYQKYIEKHIKRTKENNTLYIDDHNSNPFTMEFTDGIFPTEFKIQRNTGIKSLFIHPEAVWENGTINRNWNDPKIHYASEIPRPAFVQRQPTQTTVTVSAPERFNIKTGKGSSIIDTHIARAKVKGANISNYERFDLDNPQELQQAMQYMRKVNPYKYGHMTDKELLQELSYEDESLVSYATIGDRLFYRSSQFPKKALRKAEFYEAHDWEHMAHTPVEPIEEGVIDFKKLKPEGKDQNYWRGRNNTEIGARLAQILDYAGIKDARTFTGNQLKSMFKEYLAATKRGGAPDNQMTKLYNSIKDWNKLAKWMSKPKNVYAILGLIGGSAFVE